MVQAEEELGVEVASTLGNGLGTSRLESLWLQSSTVTETVDLKVYIFEVHSQLSYYLLCAVNQIT